ncbi:MAG: glycosyltransferase [Pseudomonadota bacterium]
MTGRGRFRDRIDAARARIALGDLDGARRMLDELRHDPGCRTEGLATVLGLPRQLQATLLSLAKREGDALARIGYQYTLVPPTDDLVPILAPTAEERRWAAEADRIPVPRVLHQVWIGPRPVPATAAAWADHARRRGYGYRLWRESDLAEFGLDADPIFADRLVRNDIPGAVDVARYAILGRHGGIYLDCDWYPGRHDLSFHDRLPMLGLVALAEDIPRATGLGSLLLANSFIAAPPGHPVFARLLAALPRLRGRLPGAPAWWATGPLAFTLAARGGSVAVADAGLVAAAAPTGAGRADLEAMAEANAGADGGLLIAWKPWSDGPSAPD